MNHTVINIHNEYHLGDNVFNFILFYNIKKYIKKQNILINYFCNPFYIEQLQEFNSSKNIIINSIENKPSNSIQLWIESPQLYYTFTKVREKIMKIRQNGRVFYNNFYINFFNYFLNNKLHMPIKIKRFYYKDKDLLDRYKKLDPKYKSIQILILNSQPMSGQYNYDKAEWDNYIQKINLIFNVATTTKVNENILCTMDDNLTIKNIAAISTKVKVIIAINSGVVPGLLNKYTLMNVKKCYVFDDRCMYTYPNFYLKNKIHEISIDELNSIINP